MPQAFFIVISDLEILSGQAMTKIKYTQNPGKAIENLFKTLCSQIFEVCPQRTSKKNNIEDVPTITPGLRKNRHGRNQRRLRYSTSVEVEREGI
jgi:hypothetical protein